ncbi:hypothetical protein [Tautonia plasticadhaerens]|uniref:Uncharacterized protein n=1 Tax=Tautonia plasticadhaerens TaxID=2527974 RepID=A0A518HD65_9BACT|nr:hypothetical protein [Tautonia plasticadhaerens]QDV38801.1 hypothetical protein ElP_67580 [Tautonia plasticadhaerens]
MAYWFAGFFAKPAVDAPGELPEDAAWRVVESPFSGVGLRMPDLLDARPEVVRVLELARGLGIDRAEDWIFLVYTCFGGRVDSVFGLGRRGSRDFGPIEEDDELGKNPAEERPTSRASLDLMAAFGVAEEDARDFAPFRRGYWGEV